MIRRLSSFALSALLCAVVAPLACTTQTSVSGGADDTGGAESGGSGSGGAIDATGGADESGGDDGPGGESSGGDDATGGDDEPGGAGTGGEDATGGAAASGGADESGGAATGGAEPTGGGEPTGGAGPECGLDARCLPRLPVDWEGPFVWADGSPPCAGSGGYSVKEGDLHNGLVPGAPTCNCTCGAPNTSCTAAATDWGSSVCDDDAQGGGYLDLGECDSADTYSGRYIGLSAHAAGSCVPNAAGSTIPEPTWASDVRICGGALPGPACTGGTCYPRPLSPFADLCIAQDGDHECPSDFPVKKLLFSDFTDTRACGACSCGALSGAVCTASIDMFTTNDCSGSPAATRTAVSTDDPELGCYPDGTYIRGKTKTLTVTTPGTCPATQAPLSGSASPIDPVTFCCL